MESRARFPFEKLRVDTESRVGDLGRFGVKEAEHDRFTIIAGNEGRAYLDLVLALLDTEAAILFAVRDIELYAR